ncbi:MAG: ABC transporter permease [Tahibacter sp.]
MSTLSLALHFARRDLKSRYLGSFSGGVWLLLQPLLQLAVYSLVFVYIFKARSAGGADAPAYVPFLMAAMWPWIAFSEGAQRAATAIQDHAGLIGKVAIPRMSLVLAPILASFAIHGTGFLAIVVALAAFGVPISLTGILLALPAYAALLACAIGVGLLLASLQVFIRDIAPALPQVFMLWMFLSPVFYGVEMIPERYRTLLDFNPYAAFAGHFRYALLGTSPPGYRAYFVAFVFIVAIVALGALTFRRLERHFEDFL